MAYVKEIPGVNIQGRTLAEAHRNLKEALALIVEINRGLERKRHGGLSRPPRMLKFLTR